MTTKATLYLAPFGTLAVPDPDPFFGQRRHLLATLPAAFSPSLVRRLNWATGQHEQLETVLLIETLEAGIQFVQITGLQVDRFLTPWGHRTWKQLVLDDIQENPADVVVWLDSVPVAERESLREQVPAGVQMHLIATHPVVGFLDGTYRELLDAIGDGMPADLMESIGLRPSPQPATGEFA
ncbi:hypothetical protein [Leifsonia sp. fls2-241-R2A-40a]|uniref:hypothetical protein n=1 Tax=Leifsonia sp. fls2-241-R2A-40a TaxID=3040290 RepID=UPI002550A692|nr:hypothetical protein [Leifsonia sp. fls2-241-R2A-40a]